MDKKPNVAVVVIDTQYDFVMSDGLLPVPGAEAIVVPGTKYLAALDPEKVAMVLFTFDTHTAEQFFGSPENLGDPDNGIPGFPMHCEKYTPGWENVFNMQVVPDPIEAYVLHKNVFDMWEQDSRDVEVEKVTGQGSGYPDPVWDRDFLFANKRGGERFDGVDTIRIFGVASDFCVKWAVKGFLDRGYAVEIVEHLTAGILADMATTVAENFEGRVKLV